MGAAWGLPGPVLQQWQWGSLWVAWGSAQSWGLQRGGPAVGVEMGAGNGGLQCHPPRNCDLDAGAAFSLNGKSGRNLGPFQSQQSRALAAIRRQGKSLGGLGGLCAALCSVPHPTPNPDMQQRRGAPPHDSPHVRTPEHV